MKPREHMFHAGSIVRAGSILGVLVLLCALLGCLCLGYLDVDAGVACRSMLRHLLNMSCLPKVRSIYWNRLLTAEPVLSTWSRGLHALRWHSVTTDFLICPKPD